LRYPLEEIRNLIADFNFMRYKNTPPSPSEERVGGVHHKPKIGCNSLFYLYRQVDLNKVKYSVGFELIISI
jgi:hypothetical protein